MLYEVLGLQSLGSCPQDALGLEEETDAKQAVTLHCDKCSGVRVRGYLEEGQVSEKASHRRLMN